MRGLLVIVLLSSQFTRAQITSISHPMTVYDVAISNNGEMIATAGKDTIVNIYSIEGKSIAKFQGFNHALSDVAFSPDGSQVIAVDYAGYSYVLNISRVGLSGKVEGKQLHANAILDINVVDDPKLYITSGRDKVAKVWDENWNLKSELVGHGAPVRKTAFTRNNEIISISDDRSIKIWSIKGELNRSIDTEHTAAIWEMAIDKSGNMITGDRGGIIYSRNHQLNVMSKWKGHNGAISGITFSETSIVSCSGDGNIKIWTSEGKLLNTVKAHEMYCSGISISADYLVLVSAGGDGVVSVWNTENLLKK